MALVDFANYAAIHCPSNQQDEALVLNSLPAESEKLSLSQHIVSTCSVCYKVVRYWWFSIIPPIDVTFLASGLRIVIDLTVFDGSTQH